MAQNKVSLYNISDLKNTSDDALSNYLNSLKFKQSNYLVDVRLALGWGSFAIAGACGLWDYKFGFGATKVLTAIAVVAYTVLNFALTRWIKYIEKETVYQATTPDGKHEISLRTSVSKNIPIYRITATTKSKTDSSGKTPVSNTLESARSFTEWFDESGLFVTAPFQTFIASSIPTIGRYDAKRVKPETQDLLETNPELLDAMLATKRGSSSGTKLEKKAVNRTKG